MVGGFVGVDIFFVISGYLISSILYRNLYDQNNPGHVNIVDFYIRRVRRIFPALITVLLFLIVAGWFILLPNEYLQLGKHIVAGSTYLSNFWLYFESGNYFNSDSNLKPLLHLWSLGVEEQFYLIFPIFLWGLYKLKLNFIKSLTVFIVISFVLNLYFVLKGNGSYSFYMPWTRFWELSVGAILAYVVMFKPNITNKLQDKETTANALSIVGLLLILVSYLVIPQDINFPGYRAALPVLGALCIIGAGQKGIVNKKILSSKIFIFFGLISYPLYLWHWSLLSLGWICEGNIPNRWIRLALVSISIILATLTFYFIEPPLRYGKGPKVKAVALFVVLITLGGFGYCQVRLDGFSSRYKTTMLDVYRLNEAKHKLESTQKYHNYFLINDEYIDNFKEKFPDFVTDQGCVYQKDKGDITIAMVGDSHCAQLFYGIDNALDVRRSNNGIVGFYISGICPFMYMDKKLDIANRVMGNKTLGLYYKQFLSAYDWIAKNESIKVVILSHNIDASDYNVKGYNVTYYDAIYTSAKLTFEYLKNHGKNVVYVLDNPTLPFFPNSSGYKRKYFYKQLNKFEKDVYYKNKNVVEYNRAVHDAAKGFDNVLIIDNSDLFCDTKFCYSNDRKLQSENDIYFDTHHLNDVGSNLAGLEIVNKITNLLQAR